MNNRSDITFFAFPDEVRRIVYTTTAIEALHEASPDITLAELRAALADEGIAVAVSTLWRFFSRHRYTRKKDQPCARAEPSRRAQRARGMV